MVKEVIKQLKCSICQADVTAESYAAHIQSVHATPPTGVDPPNSPQWHGAPAGVQPVRGPINSADYSGGHYLTGSDVPAGVMEVKFRIEQFVHDPKGRSQLAAQISETYKKSMIGFNTTNIRILSGLGYSDLQQVVGKTIVCGVGYQPNPQRNNMPTRSLIILRVE